MRAANKGRNLRPRASVPHGPPTSDAPVLQLVRGEDDAPESERDSIPQAEMPAAVASFSTATDDVAPAATLRPDEIEKQAARAEEAARSMRAKADEVRKADEAARVARARAEDAARAEEGARAAREKAEHAARVARTEETARLAKANEARKADEADRTARAKADDARKADEAAKAAKVKADEAARAKADEAAKARKAEDAVRAARSKDDVRKVDAKKGAPAKAEDPRSKKPAERPRDENVEHDKATAHKAGSPRPAAGATVDDDHDPSSISAEFFRRDEDSVPPVEEGEDGAVLAMVLSPAALARRARLRRLVAGVVSFAAVISIAVVGKTVAAQKRTTSAPAPVAMDTRHELPKAAEPANPETKPAALVAEVPKPEPAPVAEAPKPEPAKVDDKKAEEPAKVDDKKVEEPAKPAPSGADADALRKETESLLNRGKRVEAMAKAREAIAADPTHAMPYLYLGSALQDSGKWKDGIEAYSECVRNATKGPVNECRAMGGHK